MAFDAAAVLGTSEGLNPRWEPVRASLFQALLSEHPNADALDVILLERVAYLYARLRQKESLGSYSRESEYKAANATLATLLGEVRKADNRAELLALIRSDAVNVVVDALDKASEDMEAEQRQELMGRVIHLVKDADKAAS